MATAKIVERSIKVSAEMLDELGLDEGDEFDVAVENDAIVLRRHEEEALDPAQAAHIREAVAEGFEDYLAGRVTPPFKDMEEFEAYRQTEEYRKLVQSE